MKLLALLVFVLPALIIPAFIHQPEMMRRTIYLVYFFCGPVAAVMVSLGKKRNVVFYLGLAAVLTPIELLCAMSYHASFVHPSQQQVAKFYLPVFFVSTVVMLPLGMALTYAGTRNK